VGAAPGRPWRGGSRDLVHQPRVPEHRAVHGPHRGVARDRAPSGCPAVAAPHHSAPAPGSTSVSTTTPAPPATDETRDLTIAPDVGLSDTSWRWLAAPAVAVATRRSSARTPLRSATSRGFVQRRVAGGPSTDTESTTDGSQSPASCRRVSRSESPPQPRTRRPAADEPAGNQQVSAPSVGTSTVQPAGSPSTTESISTVPSTAGPSHRAATDRTADPGATRSGRSPSGSRCSDTSSVASSPAGTEIKTTDRASEGPRGTSSTRAMDGAALAVAASRDKAKTRCMGPPGWHGNRRRARARADPTQTPHRRTHTGLGRPARRPPSFRRGARLR